MEYFVGVNLVQAELMTSGEYSEYSGCELSDTDSNIDGYHVKYICGENDGYESWFPKDDFEKLYTAVGENILTDTALLMTSVDYKERFKAEYHQLVYRFRRLVEMLEKWEKGKLDFVPSCPRGVYNIQVRAMSEYIAILEARAVIENIQL